MKPQRSSSPVKTVARTSSAGLSSLEILQELWCNTCVDDDAVGGWLEWQAEELYQALESQNGDESEDQDTPILQGTDLPFCHEDFQL